MRTLLAIAVIAGAGLVAIASVHAMPIAPAHHPGSMAIDVADGCGPNGHRGPHGHCRARFSCPRGWHSGPYGWHCFRN